LKFNKGLKKETEIKTNENNVEQKLFEVKTKILKAGEIFLGKPNYRPIITPVTKEMIKKREFLKREARREPDKKLEYYENRKKVKKEIRKDVRNFELLRIDEAIRNNRCLKIARDGINRQKSSILCLKDKNGILQTGSQKVTEIATTFYKTLYSSKMSDDEKNLIEPQLDDDEEIESITVDDIKYALSSMKRNKARGPDDFPIDLLKICDDFMLKKVANIFDQFLTDEKLPIDWLETNIILIFKKGKKDEIKNYRPISLISHLYKLFVKIILRRIENVLEENQPEEQTGFRSGYSTSDNLMVINQLIEKHKEYNKELFLAFIDYEKAFDSVESSYMYRALKSHKVPSKYIRIVRFIYENSTAKITVEQLGEKFEIRRGVKQGDPMSPKIFNAVLDFVFQNLNWKNKGLKIDVKNLTNLRFADDIVLMSESKEELLKMIKELDVASKKVGLSMNKEKTQVMSNTDDTNFEIDGWKIEKVEEYKYLGQIVSFQHKMTKELDTRISAAWRSFWALKKFLLSELPIYHKRNLMDSVILPVFTYGAQTWTLSNEDERRLRCEQKAMERRILKISLREHRTNEEIRNITKFEDVVEKARKLKWDWAGHLQRMNKNRWAKSVENWTPTDGRRNRGHQMKRWKDDIEKVGLGRWREKTNDRMNWKALRETYVQKD
jgi:Reverse transcriptase (RNA-dependent DNA polymerase)